MVVLEAQISEWTEKSRNAPYRKTEWSKQTRRVISRRVSIIVSGKREIEIPTDVHPRCTRFPWKPVSSVRMIANQTKSDELHYNDADFARMAADRGRDARTIRDALKTKGFCEDDNDTTIEGLEELVFPQKTAERMEVVNDQTKRFMNASVGASSNASENARKRRGCTNAAA